MAFISGIDRSQTQMLPMRVEDYVPADSPVRVIDAFVEKLDLSRDDLKLLRRVAAMKGRPSYHPKTLLKLYLYAYVHRIRSSRRIEAECYRNLEVMWLVGGLRPDHKTIAEFRKLNPDLFPQVFREFNLLCRRLNLFAAELIAIDGSKFKACNSSENCFNEKQLVALLERVDAGIAKYLERLNQGDAEAEGCPGPSGAAPTAEQIKLFNDKLDSLAEEKEKCEKLLKTLRESPKNDISVVDGDSRRMQKGRGPGNVVGYNAQVAVDGKHGLIVAERVVTEANDLGQLAPMARAAVTFFEKTQSLAPPAENGKSTEEPQSGEPQSGEPQSHAQDLAPDETTAPVETATPEPRALQVLADSGYSEANQLEDCEILGVEPIVPRRHMKATATNAASTKTGATKTGATKTGATKTGAKKTEIYPKSDFHYDADKNVYVCPAKNELPHVGDRKYRGKEYRYYKTKACTGCPFKELCTTGRYRTIVRRSNEIYVERAAHRLRVHQGMMRVRSSLVEKIFGTLKGWGFGEFLTRGKVHVQAEFSLSAFAYNFKRCINLVGVDEILKAIYAG